MQLWTDSLGKSVYAYETMYGNIVDSSDDYYVVGNAMTIHKLVDDEGLVKAMLPERVAALVRELAAATSSSQTAKDTIASGRISKSS
jgi:hypothetical protein